jgi:hypothetical protein
MNAHEDLASFRSWRVDLAHLQPVGFAMVRNNNRLHTGSCSSFACTATAVFLWFDTIKALFGVARDKIRMLLFECMGVCALCKGRATQVQY